METSQCHTSHVKSFIHHLYTKDSSQTDRWAQQLDIHKKPTFRSKHSTYTDSISPTCWSLEDLTKHGQSSYSHSLPAPTLEQTPLCESSSGDDLSASWSSSSTSRSSLPSPDLDDQGHNGWLTDFHSYSPSSSPMVYQQHISQASVHMEQQARITRYTYYPRPNISARLTPDTHQAIATTQDKIKNWEMAFDWYEHDKYNDSTIISTVAAQNNSITQADSLEMNSAMTMVDNQLNDAPEDEASGHDSTLETEKGNNNNTRQASFDHDVLLDKTETMMDATDWNKLGMDLQETEQDVAAIDAFRRAVDLDANILDAWLNLAISYTNEHQRGNAYDCLEAWLQHNDKYQHIWKPEDNKIEVMMDRNKTLVERYILAARCAPGDTLDTTAAAAAAANEMDADVQVILGLLFYLADETQKSIDCFRAALACRPDDHRLWNQLGSVMLSQQQQQGGNRTLELSSIVGDAMDMYWSALYLNPEYTRARYNLAVAHMKLSQYEQAAHHLVTALSHQQQQQQRQQRSKVMVSSPSSPMWSSLRLVMYMLNLDHLADACNRCDLTPFLGNSCIFTPTHTFDL